MCLSRGWGWGGVDSGAGLCQVCLDFLALFLFEGFRFQEVKLCGVLCPGPDRRMHHLCYGG